jgi:hypothetical protein
MKKTYAFFVLLITMSISNQVFGQKTLTEYFDYPAGSIMGQGAATKGWIGPWTEGITTSAGGILSAIDGNFGNDFVKAGELKQNPGYLGANTLVRVTRDFDTNSTFVDNVPGQEIWISFYFKNTINSALSNSQSYLQLSDPVNGFSCPPIGSLAVSSTTPGTLGMNQTPGIVGTLETDLTYILVKFVLDGTFTTNGDNAYMWVNYTGATAPANATAQRTRTFTVGSASKAANISRLNLLTYKNRVAYFDAIRISNTFAPAPAIKTWTGGTSVDPLVGSNWDGGVAPTSGDFYLSIPSGTTFYPEFQANFTARGVLIESGASLKVSSGNFTVTGSISNNGTLTVENNANLIQTSDSNGNTVSGTTVVKRNSNPLKRLDYTLWSSSVTGSQTLADFSPLTSQSPNRFYTYDSGTNLYTNLDPTSTSFGTGKGYLIRMPNDADAVTPAAYAGVFTGTLNNGPIPVTVATGYNLVGNPYASNISLSSLISANSSLLDATAYFWRKTNGASLSSAYCTYNNSTSTYVSNNDPVAPIAFDGTIKSGQGFFVNATAAGTLNFTNAQRTGATTNQAFFKTRQVVADKLWLNATNTVGDFSQMAVTYSAGATTGVDSYDSKFINDIGYALTSSINNEEYTIQGRPAFDPSDIVALRFKTVASGDYTIALANTEGVFAAAQDIYLVDSKTGAETNLKEGAYNFTAAAGVDNTRFSLKYQKTLKVPASALNENSVVVYKNKGTLYVNSGAMSIATVTVYDIQGRLLAEQKNVKSKTATISNLRTTNQILIVKVRGEDNAEVTKKVAN